MTRSVFSFCLLLFFSMGSFAQPDELPLLESASEYDYPPLAIVNSDGKADGFSVELLKATLKAVDRDVVIQVGQWSTIKDYLSLGLIDVLPLVGKTPEREQEMDFTQSYLTLHGNIFVRSSSKVSSIDDLKDKHIITMEGDTAHEYLNRSGITSTIIPVDSYDHAFLLLSSGQHDAIICLKMVGNQLIKKLELNNIKAVGSPIPDYHQEFAYAVLKGDKEMLDQLNRGLALVKTDGTYQKLYDKWITPALTPIPTYHPATLWLLKHYWIFIVIVIILTFAFIVMQQIIRSQTRHLSKAVKQYQRLFELSNDAIILHDDRGVILDANPQASKHLGYGHQSLVTKTLYDIHPEPDHPFVTQALKHTMLNGNLMGETKMVDSTGKTIVVEISASVIDPQQKLIQGIFRDITERKQFINRLRESEQKFRSIIEGAADGVLIADQQNRQFIYSNPAISKLLGYSQAEFMTMAIQDIHPKDQLEKIIAYFEKHAKGEIVDEDIPCLRKDDTIIHCHITVSVISMDGRPYSVGFFRDMTDIRSMSEQISQNDKMQAIGQLAGGIAHDFNNYLTGIIGYAQRIQRKSDHTMSVETAEQISNVAKNLADLNNKLLTFARKAQFISKPIDVHEVIHSLISLLEHTFEKKISISKHLSAKNCVIDGDRAQVENALLNLAINARDAMPDGGTISFTTEIEIITEECDQRAIDTLTPGSYIVVTIMDTGAGIPEQTLPHIFEPFFTTKPIGKGNGMGLASVYGTIKRHKGSIHVDTEVEKGTSFEVILPLSKTPSGNPG